MPIAYILITLVRIQDTTNLCVSPRGLPRATAIARPVYSTVLHVDEFVLLGHTWPPLSRRDHHPAVPRTVINHGMDADRTGMSFAGTSVLWGAFPFLLVWPGRHCLNHRLKTSGLKPRTTRWFSLNTQLCRFWSVRFRLTREWGLTITTFITTWRRHFLAQKRDL